MCVVILRRIRVEGVVTQVMQCGTRIKVDPNSELATAGHSREGGY